MKKHPVDQLFKKGLEGLEKIPSDEAWAKLSDKIKEPQRWVFPRWLKYAACFLLATFAGFWLWQFNEVEDLPGRSTHGIASVSNETQEQVIQKEKIKMPVEDRLAEANTPVKVAARKVTKGQNQIRTVNVIIKEPEVRVDNPASPAEVGIANTEPEIAFNGIPQQESEMSNHHISDEGISNVNEILANESRLVVVKVDVPTEKEELQKSKTKFSKIFKQLKNMRSGDPVNWDDVGFNPQTIIAKVDSRLSGESPRR